MATPLGIRQRTFSIRNHLKEMATAAQHMDLKRMQSHKDIIEDHLHELDHMARDLQSLSERIVK